MPSRDLQQRLAPLLGDVTAPEQRTPPPELVDAVDHIGEGENERKRTRDFLFVVNISTFTVTVDVVELEADMVRNVGKTAAAGVPDELKELGEGDGGIPSCAEGLWFPKTGRERYLVDETGLGGFKTERILEQQRGVAI